MGISCCRCIYHNGPLICNVLESKSKVSLLLSDQQEQEEIVLESGIRYEVEE